MKRHAAAAVTADGNEEDDNIMPGTIFLARDVRLGSQQVRLVVFTRKLTDRCVPGVFLGKKRKYTFTFIPLPRLE